MNRVFLDANVLFSAAISSGGVTRAIFELAEQHPSVLELVVSEYAITEALRNLQQKRPEAVSGLLSLIDGLRFTQEPPGVLMDRLRELVSDSKDVPIVAGAVWAEADIDYWELAALRKTVWYSCGRVLNPAAAGGS